MKTLSISKTGLLFGVAGLAVALAALWRLDASVGDLTQRVEALQAAVERLEDTGRSIPPASVGAPSAPARGGLVGATDALEARLSALEALAGGRPDASADGATGQAEPADVALSDGAIDEPPELVARHAREHGASAWGRRTAGQLEWQYADNAFFGRHGGSLALDCRRSICRVRWDAPHMAGLPPEESERIAAMANYELLAVIAAGARDVGPILRTESGAVGPATIELYFEQQERQQ